MYRAANTPFLDYKSGWLVTCKEIITACSESIKKHTFIQSVARM